MPPRPRSGPAGAPTYTRRVIETATGGFLSVGQPTARRIALRSAASGPGASTLLVHGPRGAGKGIFVDDLLALAFCTDPDPDRRPCNACRGCRDGRARVHPDLVIGSPEQWRDDRSTGESAVGVARRWLLEAAGAPVVASRRVVLIEGADRANEHTQNALLKALEEPTLRHAFILVADDASRLLPTIRSRCQPIRIGPVEQAVLIAHLMAAQQLPEDQARALVRIAHGLAGTAIGFADHAELIDWRRRTQVELLALLERGPADRLGAVGDLLDEAARVAPTEPVATPPDGDVEETARTPAAVQRGAAGRVVEVWTDLARDLLVAAAGRADLAPSGELGGDLDAIADRIPSAELTAMITLLERVADGLRENAAAAPRDRASHARLAPPRAVPDGGGRCVLSDSRRG